MSLEIFYKKFAERLLASASNEIEVQGQPSSPAGRLVGTDNFLCRIPATHAKMEGKCQRSCCMYREKQAADPENCNKMHYNVLLKKRHCSVLKCITQN
jgi:hypothetical protein